MRATTTTPRGRGRISGQALGLLALVGASLAPAAGARSQARAVEPPAWQAPAAVPQELQSRELRRVLHLAGGHTLRAKTRRGEGGWEYRAGRKWQSLPSGSVVRAALEKEVLAEMRARRRAIDRDSLSDRTELAGWMLSAGLLEEGLAEADQILTRDREHRGIRDLLHEHAFRFRLPALDEDARELESMCDELLRYGARSVPSLRELAVLRLDEIDEREGLQEILSQALFDGSVTMRSFAALGLRRLFSGEAVRPLLSRAVMDTSEEVRVEAALALRSAEEPALVAPVARALARSPSPKVRRNSAQALGNMGYPIAVPALVSRLATLQGASQHRVPHANIFTGRQFAFIQDFDVEVAQFQAVADPQINVLIEGEVLDAGVAGVQETLVVAERRAIQSSLGALTGENPGRYARDWLKWWEQNSTRWLPQDGVAKDD